MLEPVHHGTRGHGTKGRRRSHPTHQVRSSHILHVLHVAFWHRLLTGVRSSASSEAAHTASRRTIPSATTDGRDPCVSCHRDRLGDERRSAAQQRDGRTAQTVSPPLWIPSGKRVATAS